MNMLKGRCPACNHETLNLDKDGYVFCGWAKCTDSTLIDQILHAEGGVFLFDHEGHSVHDMAEGILATLVEFGTVYEVWK